MYTFRTLPYTHSHLRIETHVSFSFRIVSFFLLNIRTQGLAILCMARASSDMTIEAQCDWGNISMTEWQGGTFKTGSPTPLADA